MPLRMADINATRRFEDGDDWIVLRTILTKGESDAVRDLTASYSLDPKEVEADAERARVEIQNRTAQGNRALFGILCQDWSLGPVSPEAYGRLDEESGRWVDECIAAVLRERRERAEKKVSSSKRRSARGSSSAKAAA